MRWKKGKSQIGYLSTHIKNLEKEEQSKPKGGKGDNKKQKPMK